MKFELGRRNTNDAERNGRPNEAVIPWNFKKINEIGLSDRKMKLHESADIVKILKKLDDVILHKRLSIRKLYSK